MGEAQGHVGILFDEEDRCSLLVQLADNGEYFLHELRGEAHGRLVENEYLCLAHQRTSHRKHLLFSPAQGAGQLRGALAQAGKNIHDHPEVPRTRSLVAADPSAELQVFHHGETAENAAALGHMRQAKPQDLVGRETAKVAAFQQNRAFAGLHAGERTQCGRLPRAVGPD